MRILCGIALALVCAIAASAQTASALAGPPLATVQAIAMDPTNHATLYAGVYSGSISGGVFKSTDSGARWTLLNADTNVTTDVQAIVVDPLTPSTIYAGTTYAGILKSTDGGATWNPMNAGLGSLPSVSSLAIDPVTPSTLYTTIVGGLYKSINGGTSWLAANTGFSSVDILGITLDPANPATLYARVNGGGIYKSTNAAASWVAIDTGLTSTYVYALAVNPTNPATLYAGTYDSGIYKSTDAGAHWIASNTGLTDLHMGTVLAIDPLNPDTVYAASATSIFKTVNGGTSWTPANAGLQATASFEGGSYYGLVIDPSNSSTLYLGTALGGVYKSLDGAVTWSAVDNGLNTNPVILALTVAHANPANIYAGALWGTGFLLGGVFQSPNGGAGWTARNFGLNGVQTLAIDPTNPDVVYAGPNVNTVGFLSGGGALRSADGGVTWTAIDGGLPSISGFAHGSITTTFAGINAFAVDPTNPETVYAAPGGQIYKTTNAGGTWTSSGLPTGPSILSLAVDPSNAGTIYAGATSGTLYRSLDGAASWTALSSNLPTTGIQALAVNPSSPSTLYAGTKGSGVLTSHDGGATWAQINSGLANLSVTALAVDPFVTTTIYAGTNGSGVFKSIDGRATWHATGNNTGNGTAPATSFSKVSGDNQTAAPGQSVAFPLVTVVTNSANVPVAGVTVNFAASGDGAVASTSMLTDIQGVASTTWTLGATAGPNTVSATAAGLGHVVFSATAANLAPAISSVSNSGSFTQAFSPGMLMSVFGTGLSNGNPQIAGTIPLPVISSSGTSVTIDGIAAPLLYISATQINLQIPYETAAGSASLIVKSAGQSASVAFTVQGAAPGIFVDYQNGNVLPTESTPAGSTIAIYLTGAGQVAPAEATGNIPTAGTTPLPTLPVIVTVGGIVVTPVYIGIPSWSAGVLQINFTVPAALAAGSQQIIVKIGGVASKPALLAVTPK